MPVISPFQKLPWHIAQAVADYCISTHPYGKQTDPDELQLTKRTWMEFYNVSYLWRFLTLKHFYKQVTITILTDSWTGKLEFDYLPSGIPIDHANYSFVKRVIVDFAEPEDYFVRGSIVELLSRAWADSIVFPLARSLNVLLSDLYFTRLDRYKISPEGFEHFSWIAQSLPSSIPNIQELTVRDNHRQTLDCRQYDARPPNTREFLWTVFSRVMSLDCRMASIGSMDKGLVQPDMRPTKLTFMCFAGNEWAGYVLEMTASFLELLDVADIDGSCAHFLTLSPDNKPITYPRLHRLGYHIHLPPRAAKKCQLDKSIVPFPALRQLTWSATYIFTDDTLFRGNSDSLEYLDIRLDITLLNVLQKYQVFSSGRYSQLSHIAVRDSHITAAEWTANPGLFAEVTGAISTLKMQSLSIDSRLTYEEVAHCIVSNSYAVNIRTLHISGVRVTLPELLELLRRMPNMARLCLHNPGKYEARHDDTIVNRSFIDGAYTKYFPLSNQFKQLEVSQKRASSIFRFAEATILLAILCPRFTKSSNLSKDANEFELEHEIENVMKSGIYDDHKDKMQRFLRNISL